MPTSSRRASSITSPSVGISNCPSNAALPGRMSGMRSRAQRLELGEREVLDEPAVVGLAVDLLGRAAVGELGVIGDVGRAGDLVLVPADELAVARGHQVRLDEV